MTTTFTTWTQLKADALDKLAAYVADGSLITAEYSTPNGSRHKLRTIEEFERFIKFCDIMIAQTTSGNPGTRVSYGKHRRF